MYILNALITSKLDCLTFDLKMQMYRCVVLVGGLVYVLWRSTYVSALILLVIGKIKFRSQSNSK